MSKSIINCVINEKTYFLPQGLTLLQACEHVGVTIPRFCYHDRLSIAGNCRMCLVQVDKSVKPVASCALEISPGMKVYTNTALVKKAREGVMEFLLANHPLDCPICDQGGECDLQDQALLFGNDRGRFYETKRSVLDKDWGHLIKTVMTRCIHCTRCQRFSNELSGLVEVSMVGRGKKSEITNFIGNAILSEVSGNMIDLCPVGALTSKPYAFTARPWELTKVEHLDNTDSMGSNLSLSILGQKIFRTLPVVNGTLNEEWLSNRGRFFYDGVRLQRLLTPSLLKNDGVLNCDVGNFLLSCFFHIGPFFPFFSSVGEISVESAYSKFKIETYCNTVMAYQDNRTSFRFNTSFSEFVKADLCILVGVNLKRELPLLLVRLRFEQIRRPLLILSCGSNDLGLSFLAVGNSPLSLLTLLEGRHPLSRLLKRGVKVHCLFSSTFSTFFHQAVNSLVSKLNLSLVVSVLPPAASNVQYSKEFGSFLPPYNAMAASEFFLINSERVNCVVNKGSRFNFHFSSFGVFSALSGSRNYFFPVTFYLEEKGYYLNSQGILQLGRRALLNSKALPLSTVLFFFLLFLSPEKFVAVENVLPFNRNSFVRSTVFLSFPSGTRKIVNLPSFNPYFTSYSTTPVTYSSSLLSRSRLLERASLIFSFPN